MLQHARRGNERVTPATTRARYPEPVRGVPGRTTLAESLEVLPSNPYTTTVNAAERELEAVRRTVLPAYLAVIRDRSLPKLDKEVALARAGISLRHVLMTANQHVRVLEQAMTLRDPMVLHLRSAIDQLIKRARLVGAYRGFEELVPKPHIEPSLQDHRVHKGGAFGKTAHAKAAIPATRSVAPASIVRARAAR